MSFLKYRTDGSAAQLERETQKTMEGGYNDCLPAVLPLSISLVPEIDRGADAYG